MSRLRDAATWARETFPTATAFDHALKAEHEWEEWLNAETARDAVVEAADVVIVLAAWADRLGYDLEQVVAEKLATNRARTWERQPDGTWGHA